MYFKLEHLNSLQNSGIVPQEYLHTKNNRLVDFSLRNDDGILMGLALIVLEPGKKKKTAQIAYITIDKAFRNMGYGSMLLGYVCDFLNLFEAIDIECLLPPAGLCGDAEKFFRANGFAVNDDESVYMEYDCDTLTDSDSKLERLKSRMETISACVGSDYGPYSITYSDKGRLLAGMDISAKDDCIYIRDQYFDNETLGIVAAPAMLLEFSERLRKAEKKYKKVILSALRPAEISGIRTCFGTENNSYPRLSMRYSEAAESQEDMKPTLHVCSLKAITGSELYRTAAAGKDLFSGIFDLDPHADEDSIDRFILEELKNNGAELAEDDLGLGRYYMKDGITQAILLGKREDRGIYDIYGYFDLTGNDRTGIFLKMLFSQAAALARVGDENAELYITVSSRHLASMVDREFGSKAAYQDEAEQSDLYDADDESLYDTGDELVRWLAEQE